METNTPLTPEQKKALKAEQEALKKAPKAVSALSDKEPDTNVVVIGRNSAQDEVADLAIVSGILNRVTFDTYNKSKKDNKIYGAYVGFVNVEGSIKKATLDANDVVAIGSQVNIRKHIRVSDDGKTYHSYALA